MSNPTTLNIAHFNDVYQASEQSITIDGKPEKIDVTKFAASLENVTSQWKTRSDGHKDGLVIFSGDLFSPSIESSTTRGGHMPAIVNAMAIDVSVPGNHEFDFGYPRLKELIGQTNFPWLLSNIIDTKTGQVPEPMKAFHILERAGVRIGFVGLVEKDWIPTITGWPANFEYRDMAEVGKALSAKLRDPAGQYKCDFIIAVTHSLTPNDIKLAKQLLSLSPAAQKTTNIASEHGVDILLGGHNHYYWISKGVTAWDNYDLQAPNRDSGEDLGDVLIVKSGTDFQDLSEVVLTLVDTPAGSVRRKVIQEIRGKRHVTREALGAHPQVQAVVQTELATIDASWKEPVCITDVELDVRSACIRSGESPVANWIADCLRHAYDGILAKQGYPTTDGVIFITGSFRARTVYPPETTLTIKDIIAIVPNPDPTVVVEISGNDLWDALEVGLKGWPKAGGFPAISGFRVEWDHTKPAGQRVTGVWLLAESDKVGADGKPVLVDKEEVTRASTRKYLIMTGEYQTQGGDGYTSFMDRKLVVPAENGQNKAALIRKFLLGAQQLNKKTFTDSAPGPVITQGLSLLKQSPLSNLPLPVSNLPGIDLPNVIQSGLAAGIDAALKGASALITVVTAPLFIAALAVAEFEDLGLLDGYARQRARMAARRARAAAQAAAQPPPAAARTNLSPFGLASKLAPKNLIPTRTDSGVEREEARIDQEEKLAVKSLPRIRPVVDGRLKDVAQA